MLNVSRKIDCKCKNSTGTFKYIAFLILQLYNRLELIKV